MDVAPDIEPETTERKRINHETMKEKVVLAFSGGLDTSFCAKYLAE